MEMSVSHMSSLRWKIDDKFPRFNNCEITLQRGNADFEYVLKVNRIVEEGEELDEEGEFPSCHKVDY